MKQKTLRILIIITALLLLNSCISPPENFVAPVYDVTFAFPLTDTLFTINEFIKDDSSIVASNDPEKLGILVYNNSQNIDPFYIDENLELDSFSTSTSSTIGTIKINDVPPFETKINISDWASVAEGTQVIFPPATSPVSSRFSLINEFEHALFESGTMEITIYNNLPVASEFRNLKIINKLDGSTVVENSTSIAMDAFDSSITTLNLQDVLISNNLEIQGTIYTSGSGITIVTIPQNAGTKFSVTLSNLVIQNVTAELPEQNPITIQNSFQIDDSTKINTIRFDDGSFQIIFNNYFDIDLNIDFEIKNLFDNNNNIYSQSFNISRNERNKIIEVPSLKDWEIRTTTSGIPTNQLEYSATILAEATSDVRTITKNDSVSINIAFNKSSIAFAQGLIKPTKFDITESEFNFDLGDLENNFNFDSLNISNPKMILDLASSVNFDVSLNSVITGTSDNLSKALNIALDLPAGAKQEFDLNDFGFAEFVNSFTIAGEIPNKFTFSGSGTINKNYDMGSISKVDSVDGSFAFDVPLEMGISGGSFKDTVNFNSVEISDDDIDAINEVDLTIETLNKIPANIVMKGEILDKYGNPLSPSLSFPPSYSSENFILLAAPTVDEYGNVIASEMNKQVIRLRGDDAKRFINNPNIAIKFSLDTPPMNSVATVKFRNTDEIYFKIYGKVNYKMNNN